MAGTYQTVVPGVTWPVAPGSFDAVEVHGEPAVLVRGDWVVPIGWTLPLPGLTVDGKAADLKWDDHRGLSLYWTSGDLFYLLWTYNPAVTADDLIDMAESAK